MEGRGLPQHVLLDVHGAFDVKERVPLRVPGEPPAAPHKQLKDTAAEVVPAVVRLGDLSPESVQVRPGHLHAAAVVEAVPGNHARDWQREDSPPEGRFAIFSFLGLS